MKPSIMPLLLSVLIVFIVTSCNFDEDVKDRSFNQNLQSFNKSFGKVDSAIVLIDEMQAEIDKIEVQHSNGQIDSEQAEARLDRIRNSYGRRIARNSNVNPATKLPVWASRLGLAEPQGMVLDADYSQATSERNEAEGFNSVVLVYNGTYERAMNQAQIIAAKAGIPMSKDFVDAQMLAKEYGIETLKGMAYMNFEMGAIELPHYTTAITVDEAGTLTISVTDTKKLAEQLEE